MAANEDAPKLDTLDWDSIGRAVLGSAILAGVASLAFGVISQYWSSQSDGPDSAPRPRNDEPLLNDALSAEADETDIDPEAAEAAALLGVDLEATVPEIRAALRARIISGSVHPDHGGDGEEARRLIAARDLLLARIERIAP